MTRAPQQCVGDYKTDGMVGLYHAAAVCLDSNWLPYDDVF